MLDVLVHGAGPAGATVATLLAQAGVAVGIDAGPVEAGRGARRPGGFGEIIPGPARPLVEALDLGMELDACSVAAHGRLSAWGHEGLAVVDAVRDPHGAGWALDRDRLDERLRRRAREAGARTVDAGAPAALVIDASGRAATHARRRSARRVYDCLVARYAWFQSTRGEDLDARVLVESDPDGWWYTALTSSGARIVARMSDASPGAVTAGTPKDAAELSSLATRRTRFLAARLRAYAHRPASPLRGADARTICLACPAGPDWLAVGDAAFAVDPISSQGVVNAWLTARLAARAALDMLDGDAEAAMRYADTLRGLFDRYLTLRREVYRQEHRWPDTPFWSARHAPLANDPRGPVTQPHGTYADGEIPTPHPTSKCFPVVARGARTDRGAP